MRPIKFIRRGLFLAMIISFSMVGHSHAQPSHGIAMYGEPELPPDFVSLPYVNPDAPKGGRIVTGEVGSFDSLNPHILKGRVPWQLRYLAYESLMGRSWDEPFTLYGLLAESVDTGPNREWVEFVLREEARFSDGSPVTVEDVLWSYETLGTIGNPRYLSSWQKVQKAEITGDRSIRFTFHAPEPELALIFGLRPILKKSQWDDVDFTESGLKTIPIATAPYIVSEFEAGRFVTLKRNPDYWGNDLPLRRGTNNLDEIRMEFFSDADVMFEAFKAGELNTLRETSQIKWDERYNFPSVQSGNVIKSEIPHERPTGIAGLAMNTRRAVFSNWQVRDAMLHLFNYEFINNTLNAGKAPRITSYYSNSLLAMADGPADQDVKALLLPYADTLTPDVFDGYHLPNGSKSERNRKDLGSALKQLSAAGWNLVNGVMQNEAGVPLSFEILLQTGSNEIQAVVDIYVSALKRAGIDTRVTLVDSAQYKERTQAFDFDMAYYSRGVSLSPGNEQLLYWGSASADQAGSRNWMGIRSQAVDASINALLSSTTRDEFLTSTRALDRALTTGRYVIPIWYSPVSRIAHDKHLHYPENLPIYGDWIGFHPDVWWWKEE